MFASKKKKKDEQRPKHAAVDDGAAPKDK